jgi:lipopolysaccharide/colanic/teichoic acid biosynthesis glycosyltransferase
MVRCAAAIGSRASLAAKRALDLAGGLVLGVVLIPPLLVAAAAVRLLSRGPVLFAQERLGRHGTPFQLYKLRTMHVGSEEALAALVAADDAARSEWDRYGCLVEDPRIVPLVGPLLRRTSLDELPQLWNVLRGDMSLVGPRPLQESLLDGLEPDLVRLRTMVRPGLTGLWQVSGRSELDLDRMVELDARYVGTWSLRSDLRILSRTPRAVLRRQGAY